MPAASGSTHSNATRPSSPAMATAASVVSSASPPTSSVPSTRSGRRTGACTWIVPSATPAPGCACGHARASSDRAQDTGTHARSSRVASGVAALRRKRRRASPCDRRASVYAGDRSTSSRIGAPPRPCNGPAQRQSPAPSPRSGHRQRTWRYSGPSPGAAMRSAAIDSSPCAAPAGQCRRTTSRSNRTPATSRLAIRAVAVRACTGQAQSASSNSVKMRAGMGRAYPQRREARMNPRILLVEDDPTSRAFLLAATRALPAEVDLACDMAGAIEAATACAHALWLFDARLPDGSGAQLLALLRERGLDTPAIAHTASPERDEHEALRAAGFRDVVAKPLPAAEWTAALRRALGQGAAGTAEEAGVYARTPGAVPVWDEAQALAALGHNPAHVSGLRQLFVSELPGVRDAVVAAAERGDAAA